MLSNTDMQAVDQIKAIITPEEEKRQQESPPQAAPQEPENISEESGAETGDDLELDESASPEDTEPTVPAIDPPAGLTADETEVFRNSPPDVQKAWARREQARQKEIRRLQNEHADFRKNFEKEQQSLTAARQQLEQQMALYGDNLAREFQEKFADVTDPVKLAALDPVRATEFNAYVMKLNQVKMAREQAAKQSEIEGQQALAAFRQEQNEILRETLKLDSQEKFEKWDGEITEYLTKAGFRPEQIQRASASAITMAHKAMLYDRAKAKRQEAEKAKNPPPKFVKPGVQSNASPSDEQRAAAMKRLRKSGDLRDAAAAIKGML